MYCSFTVFKCIAELTSRIDMQQGNLPVRRFPFIVCSLSVFFLCPRIKTALHFHPGNAGIYLLPCRTELIIVGSLQSPMHFRLRFRFLLIPAHACGIRQYLITIPVIHMDGGTRPLKFGFTWLTKQDSLVVFMNRPLYFDMSSVSIYLTGIKCRFQCLKFCITKFNF